MKCVLVVFFGFLAITTEAHAWGDTGHKVVCELALRLVAPETRGRIEQLISTDGEFRSFADSCSWPDHPRKRAAEHFLNLPRESTGLSAENCGESPQCVVTAIDKDFAVLASKSADAQSKLAALKYLGHWVGDVHQPMHVSFADDRGGNDIKASGDCGPNLHAVWDTCLVQKVVGDDLEMALRDMMGTLTDQQRRQWADGAAKDWANESFALTERSETRYCVREGTTCAPPAERLRIDPAYLAANVPVVRVQLLKAGVRLAYLLDRALAP